MPASRAARRTREGVRIAAVVAEGDHARGPNLGQQALHRLALAASVARPEVHDEPPSIVREVVRGELAVDGLDGRLDGGASGDPVLGLANVERDRGPLALDEQPGGRPSSSGTRVASCSAGSSAASWPGWNATVRRSARPRRG